jgi:hypothetical protein
MALSYFVNFWHQNARIIYRHFNKIAKIPVLNFSKSRNKIVEPRAADFPKKQMNEFVYLFRLLQDRKTSFLFVFWENLRLNNFVLRSPDLYLKLCFFSFLKTITHNYILVKRFPYFFPLTVTYWSFLSAVLAF